LAEWKSPRAFHATERRALRWLRLAAIDAPEESGPSGKPRSPLAGIFHGDRASRAIFLAPDAPFVAPAEREFLRLTTYCQRSPLPSRASDPTLDLAASVAAQLLIAGVRLPPPISSDPPDLVKPQSWFAQPASEPAPAGEARIGTVRARVIALLDRQGTASRDELLALGMSRQYLSLLVRSGVLVRVGKTFHRSSRASPSS
jgi:hypothetical protein